MEWLLWERYVGRVGFARHDGYGKRWEKLREEVVECEGGGGVIGGGVIAVFFRFFFAGEDWYCEGYAKGVAGEDKASY